jgi:hypothetical protein
MPHQNRLRHTVRHDHSYWAWNIGAIRKREQSIECVSYQANDCDAKAPNGDENQSDSKPILCHSPITALAIALTD